MQNMVYRFMLGPFKANNSDRDWHKKTTMCVYRGPESNKSNSLAVSLAGFHFGGFQEGSGSESPGLPYLVTLQKWIHDQPLL